METAMKILFRAIQKVDPRNITGIRKWFAQAIHPRRLSSRDVATLMAAQSTISIGDAMGAIETYWQVVKGQLAMGNIVECGDFATLYVNIKSKGEDTKEKVDVDSIVGNKLIINPTELFQQSLKTIQYEKKQE